MDQKILRSPFWLGQGCENFSFRPHICGYGYRTKNLVAFKVVQDGNIRQKIHKK
jgi:hypothetical protein